MRATASWSSRHSRTTGLFAAASPWLSGRDHKERMLAWRRCAPFINLTRDHGHGRVPSTAPATR